MSNIFVSSVFGIKSKKKPSTLVRNENFFGFAFLSINFVGYVIFRLVPILLALVLSFSKWNFIQGVRGIKIIGLDHYKNLLTDPIFIVSLINTIVYAIALVPISIFLALILGVILNEYVFGKGLLRLAFYIPYVSSMVAVSMVWMILFLPSYGPINNFFRTIGITDPPRWLNSSNTSLLSIIIVGVWQSLGYNIIIVLAGLQGISRSLYESADIDGANIIQKFFRITVPSLSSTMFFLVMICFIRSFQVFTPVQVMTQGGPGNSSSVLVYYIYRTAFLHNNIGYASAMSWVLFLLVFVFTVMRNFVMDRNKKSKKED
ncbi:carbohydrate ABC transporter permease [Leadbettera azotonutricia]|uniref:ABC transporter, permease protein n=1 Tax=Leadbettera azotonutricia (strain ATCC BAA-888 / DSM 13862 / ZAS-9) TaxID=545695 RepID=F5YG90_LEAAZ|nr:sugar ABC transporter permease [Leadbettera azotonutricia]AEF83354.1 ABC transporter, permease protein [Leadbettera azotonutricia ZAS-9]